MFFFNLSADTGEIFQSGMVLGETRALFHNITYVWEVILKGCVERARICVRTRARNHATVKNNFPDLS